MVLNVQINRNVLEESVCSDVHLLPCKINTDGPANVSGFFTPYIEKKSDEEVLEASFRGYPLQGSKVPVPEGYTGLVLGETKKQLTETQPHNLLANKKFDSFTYWNWDYNPSIGDPTQLALDWLNISEVVRSLSLIIMKK
uniref:EOG090X0IC1 n=1 Tax=Evadne anonyx TaxID=141404 RepID=A0A9N6WVC8_9CRUS|nr:EOG090X0IC1 [Evadne anonyx]